MRKFFDFCAGRCYLKNLVHFVRTIRKLFSKGAVVILRGDVYKRQVYMVYSYLSLFFIPVLKWGRRYYVRTTCCNASVELDAELGRKIQRGEITSLPENIIPDSPATVSYTHLDVYKRQVWGSFPFAAAFWIFSL